MADGAFVSEGACAVYSEMLEYTGMPEGAVGTLAPGYRGCCWGWRKWDYLKGISVMGKGWGVVTGEGLQDTTSLLGRSPEGTEQMSGPVLQRPRMANSNLALGFLSPGGHIWYDSRKSGWWLSTGWLLGFIGRGFTLDALDIQEG